MLPCLCVSFPALGVLRRTRTSDHAPGALFYFGFRFALRLRHRKTARTDLMPWTASFTHPETTRPHSTRGSWRGVPFWLELSFPLSPSTSPTAWAVLHLPCNSRLRMFMFFGLIALSCLPVFRERFSPRYLTRDIAVHRPRGGLSRVAPAPSRTFA